MRNTLSRLLEAGRELEGRYASPPRALYGRFQVAMPPAKKKLLIMASDGHDWADAQLPLPVWEHVRCRPRGAVLPGRRCTGSRICSGSRRSWWCSSTRPAPSTSTTIPSCCTCGALWVSTSPCRPSSVSKSSHQAHLLHPLFCLQFRHERHPDHPGVPRPGRAHLGLPRGKPSAATMHSWLLNGVRCPDGTRLRPKAERIPCPGLNGFAYRISRAAAEAFLAELAALPAPAGPDGGTWEHASPPRTEWCSMRAAWRRSSRACGATRRRHDPGPAYGPNRP